MSPAILAPSILSADFTHLAKSITYIEENKAPWIHIDIMDGSFVPNISFGPMVVQAIRPLTKLIFDVHLMINNPQQQFERFVQAGADILTFHYENVLHHHRIIEQIHAFGKKAGISIVPSTPVAFLKEILPYLDVVLIMSVNPGFGGQKLIPSCLQKITELKKLRTQNNYSYAISVDGGVNEHTVKSVIDAGTDVVVSGSAFFSGSLLWNTIFQ